MCAARELCKHNVDVLVLEARPRVGGRTLTKVTSVNAQNKLATEAEAAGAKSCWCDLGASYVGPTQDSVLNLIDELHLDTYLVDDTQRIGCLRSSGRRAFFEPHCDPPLGGLIEWLDYVNMVRLIDAYGAQIPPEAPWEARRAREWDAKSFAQFVRENAWTRQVRDYFTELFCAIDVCAEANEVSMLWFLWYVRQCGGYGRTIATTNGGQERKVHGGTQQLSERVADALGSQRVALNKPVCKIEQQLNDHATPVAVMTTHGETYRADQVICALPPHLLLKIHHEPALPAGKSLLAQRSPMGQVSKVILYYERAFWKQHSLSGCFMFVASSESDNNNARVSRKHVPVILSLDETKPDGSAPAIIGFVGARGWHEMHSLTDAQVAKIVAKCYAWLTQLDEFNRFTRFERFDWTHEQYSGGCYTSTHGVNTLTKFGKHLREPFGRIYYAGTETATKWSGYMDGAVSAGKRAARQVLYVRGLIDAKHVWQEEPESRTVPPKAFEYPASHKWAPSVGACVAGALGTASIAVGVLALLLYKRLAK